MTAQRPSPQRNRLAHLHGLASAGALAVTLATSLVTAPAFADGPQAVTDAARTDAATRYNRGREFYTEENFPAALVEFRKSYELTNEYRVLYNIGQVCFQMQDYVCGLTSFERYLQEGGASIPQQRREEVNADIEKLRARVGYLRIVANVPEVSITVDDIAVGTAPISRLPMNAGRHRVQAVKEGRVPVTRIVELAGAENQELKLELVQIAERQVIVRETGAAAPPSRWTPLSYTGLAAAGAMAVGATVTGVMALSASNEVKNSSYYLAPSAEDKQNADKANTLALTTDILIAASAVTLATTLFFTLTRNPEAAAPKTSLVVGPSFAGLNGKF